MQLPKLAGLLVVNFRLILFVNEMHCALSSKRSVASKTKVALHVPND